MFGGRWCALLLVAGMTAGCGREPGTYNLPLHEAFQRLATNELEDFKFKRQCGILVHLVPDAVADQSVTWRVFSSDVALLDFTAHLTAVGSDKTKVTVEVSKDPDGTEAYQGADFYRRPAFHQPLRPAVEEAIAAVLEGREFDVMRLPRGGDVDRVCSIQRSGLESGHKFSVNDGPEDD